jgi:hypothetical protein
MNRRARRKAASVNRGWLHWAERLEAYLAGLPHDVRIRTFAHVLHDVSCPANKAGENCTCQPTITVRPVPGDGGKVTAAAIDETGKAVILS